MERLDLILKKFNCVKKFLGTINDQWKCEISVSLRLEALEKAKVDAIQPRNR
jgi:hypothetical protein